MTANFQELWDSDVPLWGGWCSIPSSYTAELIGRAGYDWVGIDYQHGAMSQAGLDHMIQALAITRTPTFVRVPTASISEISKALDAGALGVIVPMVNTQEEAALSVAACRYSPLGIRSWAGPSVRAAIADPGYTPETANGLVKCVVMIETVEACERIEEILEVEGIDGVFIGPSDLSHSGGYFPSLDERNDTHVGRIKRVLAATLERGIVPGIFSGSPEVSKDWARVGFRMMALADDTYMLRSAASKIVEAVRARPD
jgi:4-hydroxy-2-oxoheptanedioate aldolase